MHPSSVGFGPMDPNTSRILEQTVALVQEVDQRLQGLKVGLAQAIPQLAPTLLWKELALQSLQQTPGIPTPNLYGAGPTPFTPQGVNPQAPHLGIPSNLLAQQIALAQAMGQTGAPHIGITGNPSATFPFGAAPGFGTLPTQASAPFPYSASPFTAAPSVFGQGVSGSLGIGQPFRLH